MISALTLENTHMPASGRPLSRAEVEAVTNPAREAGLRGARRRRPHLERGRGARRQPRGARGACRHAHVLPVEGARRADGIRALRPERRHRRPLARSAAGSAASCGRAGSSRRRASWRSRRWSTGSPTTTRGRAAWPTCSPTASRAASTRRPCARTSSAHRSRRCPTRSSSGWRSGACAAGTIDARTVRFVTHKDVDDAWAGSRDRRLARDRRRGRELNHGPSADHGLLDGHRTGGGGGAHQARPRRRRDRAPARDDRRPRRRGEDRARRRRRRVGA